MLALLWLLVLGLGVVGSVIWAVLLIVRQRRAAKEARPKSAAELAEERDRAAQRELAAGHFEAARRLFLEAKRPGKAAQVAVREGKLELAGDLFTQAKLFEKALVCYRRAGSTEKLRALQERVSPKKAADEPAVTAPAEQASAPEPAAAAALFADAGSFDAPALPAAAEASRDSDADADATAAEALISLPSDASSDAWLLEEDLLDLPRDLPREPANDPKPASTAQQMALGVIGLVKTRKTRGIVIEETAPARARNDER